MINYANIAFQAELSCISTRLAAANDLLKTRKVTLANVKALRALSENFDEILAEISDEAEEPAEAEKTVVCKVSFNGGRLYEYLCDDSSIHVGDKVVVPVGEHGHHTTGTVEQILSLEVASYPIEEMKRVLSKADEAD